MRLGVGVIYSGCPSAVSVTPRHTSSPRLRALLHEALFQKPVNVLAAKDDAPVQLYARQTLAHELLDDRPAYFQVCHQFIFGQVLGFHLGKMVPRAVEWSKR